jgi:sec-independent protein translocase protein TatA
LIVILMILLVVFGASRLPALGESVGRTIRGFKRGLAENDGIQITPGKPKATPEPATKPQSDIADAELVDKKS